MAAPYQNFKTESQINQEKEALRQARKSALEKAKRQYELSERQKEKARLAGEGTWMLPSVSDRIDREEETMKKAKKKKKKKEHKKKSKKEKETKRWNSSSSDFSDSNGEQQWVERSEENSEAPVTGPCLQRDSWMQSDVLTDMIPTVTRGQLREQKKKQEEKEKKANLLVQPGQHTRELNPYWKDGGKGLPQNKPAASTQLSPTVAGDGGLSWLLKAYERCQQQAKEERRSLEDVAAERYGSLKKLEAMIHEAKTVQSRDKHQDETKQRHHASRHTRYHEQTHRSRSPLSHKDRRKSPFDETQSRESYKRRDDRNQDGHDIRREDRQDKQDSKSNARIRDEGEKKACRSFVRPYDDDKDVLGNSETKQRTFIRPTENERESLNKEGFSAVTSSSRSSSSLKSKFARPLDSDEDDPASSGGTETKRKGDRDTARGFRARPIVSDGWKKPEFQKADRNSSSNNGSKQSSTRKTPRHERAQSSSSNSSSSSSEDESSSDNQKIDECVPQPPAATVLSDDEMNALGAKILRAEMMGDADLAQKLKCQLEEARKNKAMLGASALSRPQPAQGGRSKVRDDDDKVVVLTRTGRDGIVRPLPEQMYDREGRGKQRRRKNVDTHSRKGERTKYFDDDDRDDLKTLVEREKLGTAEDQNAMFARLAGRSKEQTDDDFQVDDIFISKAARQQSDSRAEERERTKAIFEHRKITAAMDKCHFCFDKVPKHLIIAIGKKVYLSLPAHRSLTAGHCLIVPMQHVASATTLDEDVWQEVQAFRKCLVQMFGSRDQDMVIMETSMYLNHFPHMSMECIPLDQETGDMAPIYFKKAIMEAGPEWSNNKKLVDLSKKDIRHSVPKGFPYFSVDFGLQGGFAHVIEDEKSFPAYFGREIVGGMLDAEPMLWRKPHREGFEDQRQKVLEFAEWWKPYDWTQQLSKDD